MECTCVYIVVGALQMDDDGGGDDDDDDDDEKWRILGTSCHRV